MIGNVLKAHSRHIPVTLLQLVDHLDRMSGCCTEANSSPTPSSPVRRELKADRSVLRSEVQSPHSKRRQLSHQVTPSHQNMRRINEGRHRNGCYTIAVCMIHNLILDPGLIFRPSTMLWSQAGFHNLGRELMTAIACGNKLGISYLKTLLQLLDRLLYCFLRIILFSMQNHRNRHDTICL
jgi:hypothetical protein